MAGSVSDAPTELTYAELDIISGAYAPREFGGQVTLGGRSGSTAFSGQITIGSTSSNIMFAEHDGLYAVMDNGIPSVGRESTS